MQSYATATRSLLCLVALAACASPGAVATSEEDIQSGRRERGYPAVGVVHMATSATFCTGTLIAPDVVLTAAHCAEGGENVDAFFTGDGQASAEDSTDPGTLGMERHEVREVVSYPGYDYFYTCPNPVPDVALVFLKTPIAGVAPVRLGSAPAPSATCRAVGFGQHDTKDGPRFLEKRSATVTVGEVRERNFDITRKNGISDHGDSGGPLYCDGVVAGVTSCLPDFPPDAVSYVSISAVAQWVEETLAKPR